MELDYKAIGKRIKIARINADMTQEQLSEAVVNLANALSVTTDALLCDSIIKARPQIEQDIAAVIADCDDYEIRMIRDVASALKETLRKNKNLQQS